MGRNACRHFIDLWKFDENVGFEKDLLKEMPKFDFGVILASQNFPKTSKNDQKSITNPMRVQETKKMRKIACFLTQISKEIDRGQP